MRSGRVRVDRSLSQAARTAHDASAALCSRARYHRVTCATGTRKSKMRGSGANEKLLATRSPQLHSHVTAAPLPRVTNNSCEPARARNARTEYNFVELWQLCARVISVFPVRTASASSAPLCALTLIQASLPVSRAQPSAHTLVNVQVDDRARQLRIEARRRRQRIEQAKLEREKEEQAAQERALRERTVAARANTSRSPSRADTCANGRPV